MSKTSGSLFTSCRPKPVEKRGLKLLELAGHTQSAKILVLWRGGSGLKLQAEGKTPYDNASMSKKKCSSSILMSSSSFHKEATTLWAHLVYGGRVDMEVEGCGLVAVGDMLVVLTWYWTRLGW